MSLPRVPKRVPVSTVAARIIKVRGYKALKDADLAALFGLDLPTFYARIGAKLWHFAPNWCFKLSTRYDRGRADRSPALAFTQPGVIMIAGILADADSLEIGMDIAYALRNRRRSSAIKKRPARRADDSKKAARYDEAKARLIRGRLRELLKKIRGD